MRLSIIYEGLDEQLDSVSRKIDIPRDELESYLDNFNKKYWPWVLKQVKFGNVVFPEDIYRVRETLDNFKQYGRNLEVRDINKYKKIADLDRALDSVMGTGSKRKGEFTFKPESLPGVEFINEYGGLRLYRVDNAESLMRLGLGTRWCTREDYPDCQTEKYIDNYGFIYVVVKDNKPFAQATPDFEQVMNIYDDPIKLPRGLFGPVEKEIIYNPRFAFGYAKRVIGDEWPEAEPYIMKDPELSFDYAIYFKDEGRWPEAEPYIMKDSSSSARYAMEVLGRRWIEAEPYIMKDPEWAFEYAVYFGGRWPEAEPYIMKSPEWAYYYARLILKRRWPEAEPYIMKDPKWAHEYIEHVTQ